MESIAELRSCVKVKVAILGPLSLTVLMVSMDIKQHLMKKRSNNCLVVFVGGGLIFLNMVVFVVCSLLGGRGRGCFKQKSEVFF